MASVRRPRDTRAWVLAAAVVSALAAAYLSLAGFFDAVRNGPAVVASVAVVAGVAIGSTVATLLAAREADSALARRMTLRSALDAACVAFHTVTGEGTEKFGADLLLVDRPRRGTPVLWTVVHGGFAQHPPTRIAWTAGKGVVGTCWQTGATQFVDVSRLTGGLTVPTAGPWSGLGADVTMGLSFAEWTRTAGYFGTIAAACIVDDARQIVGVTAVYGPPGVDLSAHEAELRSATEALAVALAGLLDDSAVIRRQPRSDRIDGGYGGHWPGNGRTEVDT